MLPSRSFPSSDSRQDLLRCAPLRRLEPEGMVRIGPMHYNTPAEVEWLREVLRSLGP